MKHLVLAAAMLTLCLTNATGQAKLLTSDPLTGLPLIRQRILESIGRHFVHIQRAHKNAGRQNLQEQI